METSTIDQILLYPNIDQITPTLARLQAVKEGEAEPDFSKLPILPI